MVLKMDERGRFHEAIQFVKLNRAAVTPALAKDGDCGFDLTVCRRTMVMPGSFVDVHSGIAMALPHGYWARITGRSSTLRKRGLLVNEGVIDQGYTGELYAGVWNLLGQPVEVLPGERLAQVIIMKAYTPPWVEVDELPITERGSTGFGSSGR